MRQVRRRAIARHAPFPVLLLGFCFFVSLAIAAEQFGNSAKGFKAPLNYFKAPHELQVQSYLEGSESELGPNGSVILHDMKLQTYREDGSKEMVVTAPQCVYDTRQQIVTSTGALQVQTWDLNNNHEVHLQGSNGFYWEQTNSFLIVSNQQSTTITGSMTNSFSP